MLYDEESVKGISPVEGKTQPVRKEDVSHKNGDVARKINEFK
jgi:hypothetical protein